MPDLAKTKYSANEILKVNDLDFGEDSGVENFNALMEDLIDDAKDVVVSGFAVSEMGTPSMNVEFTAGMAFRIAGPDVVRSDIVTGPVSVSAAHGSLDRIDLLEIREIETDYDTEQRAFKNPATGAVTYSNTETKTRVELEAQVVAGTPDSGNAPNHTAGWTKIAEIEVDATVTEIFDADIHGVDGGESGEANTNWTAETTATWRMGSLSGLKNLFRIAHAEDGSHEANSIDGADIDWGAGAGQVDGDLMPIGTNVSNTSVGTITAATVVRAALQEMADAFDMPIGTIIMFDANNAGGGGSPSGASGAWVDDTTMPGWYAMVAGNSDHGCQDMVSRFIMGKVVAGAGGTSGSDTKTIASGNLPVHTHAVGTLVTGNQSASHSHSGTTNAPGQHNHSISAKDTHSTINYGYVALATGTVKGSLTQSWESAHTHTFGTGNQSASHNHTISGSTANGGFANTPLNVVSAHYTAIYIRKCA